MAQKKNNDDVLNKVLDIYKIDNDDRLELLSIINPIYNHYEFKKRLTNKYPHHGNITLGEHILEVAVCTYKLSKKYIKKKRKYEYNLELAVKIAMLHDLYVYAWQNNKLSKASHFTNLHGFRHPIESVIDAVYWFPEIFNKLSYNDMEKLIDGIVHHMYPLPVRRFKISDINELELKNYNLTSKIPNEINGILIKVTSRHKIGNFSLSKSKFKEGRIMSKADKKVSYKQIKNPSSALALVTGKNKKLLNKKYS